MNLIGIDAATEPKKTGLARGTWSPSSGLKVEALRLAAPEGVLDVVGEWLEEPCLVCVDAPLGWPAAMAQLANHQAGAPLGLDWGENFIRCTDRVVHHQLGKKPLEVAADRIARTAATALCWLGQWGRPLAWEPGPGVIEVYPAAVLLAQGQSERDYKKAHQTPRRRELLQALASQWDLPPERADLATENADLLDALLCLLGGVDFLEGRCREPKGPEVPLAHKEGWIWFVDPEQGQ